MSSPIDNSTAKSYMDFSALGELRGQAQQNQSKALKETSQQFEGMFIQMMMKSMREATMKDEENESSARDTFEGMFDKEVSLQMAKRNAMGVANFLERAVQQQQTPVSTAAMLKARDKSGIPLHPEARPVPLNQAPAQQGLPLEKSRIKSLEELKMMPMNRSGT